jgi:pyruvate dehydrogenase E1 component alpha subunit
MHLFAPEQGILGTVPIVAATVPLAVGAAMAYKLRGETRVAVAFFGDGAMEEGQVHESMNLAALYRLPVIFVCESNLYASHIHWSERRVAGEFHSSPGERVDGNDVHAVYRAAQAAAERARQGNGPGFFECRTFRWRGHVGASYDVDVGVRRRGELEEWMATDPVRWAEVQLLENGIADLAGRHAAIESGIAQALERARRAPEPAGARAGKYVWQEGACGR